MLIYYLVLFVMIALWPFCGNEAKGRQLYVIICSTLLFLLAALRASTVGVDLAGYEAQFLAVLRLPHQDIPFYYLKDPFYYVFTHGISRVFPSFQFLLAVIGLCFACATGYSISRWSRNPQVSYVILFTWVYFCCSLSGLRQTMAVCIIWSVGYASLIHRRIIRFVGAVWIASLFHQSAWVFLLAYPLARVRLTWRTALVWGGVLGMLFASGPTLVEHLLSLGLFRSSSYASYEIEVSSRGINTALLYIGLFLFAFHYRRAALGQTTSSSAGPASGRAPGVPAAPRPSMLATRSPRAGAPSRERPLGTDRANLVLYNLMLLGIAFQLLVPVVPEFFRVSMYFSYAMVLLVPNVLCAIPDRAASRTYAYGVAAFFVATFVLLGMGAEADQYRFFWEQH